MKIVSLHLESGTLDSIRVPKIGLDEKPARQNQLGVVSGILSIGDLGGESPTWSPTSDLRDFLFPFSYHTFTTAGLAGRTGPTLAQCISAYSNTSWAGNSEFFNVSSGIQLWTVPVTGLYKLTALGATRSAIRAPSICPMAKVTGLFYLQKGDVLKILIGQHSANETMLFSGSGATFVESASLGLLQVAGGAGGSAWTTNSVGVTGTQAGPSRLSYTFVESTAVVGECGISGIYSVGNKSASGGGGGGYDGLPSKTSGGKSFKYGGEGGSLSASGYKGVVQGGFGGGGAGSYDYNLSYHAACYGGGGGYTGGSFGGANSNSANAPGHGGNGGSYLADFALEDSSIELTDGIEVHHGSLEISLIE